MAGRNSTTRPKGNGPGKWGAATGPRDQFAPGSQPSPMHKSAGKEARAAYLAKLSERQDKALQVIDRALDLALVAEDAPMVNVGIRAAFGVTEALHGRAVQAVTGEDGGPLTVVVRRLVETDDTDA